MATRDLQTDLSSADQRHERVLDRRDARNLKSAARDDNVAFLEGKRAAREERSRARHPAGGTRSTAGKAAGRIVDRQQRRAVGIAADGAGFVLGLLAWALVLSYLRGGTPAVQGWLKAKFINEPYQPGKKAAGGTGVNPFVPSPTPAAPTYPYPAAPVIASTVAYVPGRAVVGQ